MLIPYLRYDIAFAHEVVRLREIETLSIKHLNNHIAGHTTGDLVTLEYQQIKRFLIIFTQAYHKLCSFSTTADILRQSSGLIPALKLLSFIENYKKLCYEYMIKALSPVSEDSLSACELLAIHTYHQYQHNPCFERVFCFGTPSHKRRQAEPQSGFT